MRYEAAGQTDDWAGWVWQDNGDNLLSGDQVRYKAAYTDTLSDNIHLMWTTNTL